MPATAIYRDETLALRLERDQLIVERQSALDRTGAAAAVLRRRFVRVAAGSALTAAAVLIWSCRGGRAPPGPRWCRGRS
jgi:hypothetical protein